jgi:hypothetical protein
VPAGTSDVRTYVANLGITGAAGDEARSKECSIGHAGNLPVAGAGASRPFDQGIDRDAH